MAGTIRSSASVSLAILASRVLGVVRDSLFARIFGVSPLTDAYVAAFRIPNLLRDLFAEGALSSAFVPTFSDAMVKGGDDFNLLAAIQHIQKEEWHTDLISPSSTGNIVDRVNIPNVGTGA